MSGVRRCEGAECSTILGRHSKNGLCSLCTSRKARIFFENEVRKAVAATRTKVKDFIDPSRIIDPDMRRIVDLVGERFKMSAEELLNEGGHNCMLARQVVIYLFITERDTPHKEIAQGLGIHLSNINYSYKTVMKKMAHDQDLKKMVMDISSKCKSPA